MAKTNKLKKQIQKWRKAGAKKGGFKRLVNKIKKEYMAKGYSEERAEELATRTAGKIFWEGPKKKKRG